MSANEWIEFNIHNSATIRVARDAPTAELMAEMFAPFLSEGLDHHDLTITGDYSMVENAAHGEADYEYTPSSLYLTATKEQILRDEDGFRLNGRRELLITALPLIDRILVERGVAMIHAATVNYRGVGVNMPAWGGTGKTSTIAKLLRLDGVAFMGDDWAFLSEDGRLLGYAKPMSIKPHHRPIYPHLFNSKRKPLVPSRLSQPVHSMTTRIHPIVTRYPRLASFSRRWSPEHMTVTPQRAFPNASFSAEAPLGVSIFVERHDGDDPTLEEKSKDWMVSRLVGNFHAEITKHSQEVITALGATDLVPIERYFGDKAAVLDRALEGKPAFLLQVPRTFSPDLASDIIVQHIQQVSQLAGFPRR